MDMVKILNRENAKISKLGDFCMEKQCRMYVWSNDSKQCYLWAWGGCILKLKGCFITSTSKKPVFSSSFVILSNKQAESKWCVAFFWSEWKHIWHKWRFIRLCKFGGDSDLLRQPTNNNSQRAEESFSCIHQTESLHQTSQIPIPNPQLYILYTYSFSSVRCLSNLIVLPM